MSKLVIVESPTKARTIGKILGTGYTIIPSMGHVIDLPRRTLGVDVDADFTPTYVVISTKRKVLTQLKKLAKKTDTVFLATDPDREGEAISWHLQQQLSASAPRFLRVVFHEITPQAIKEAFVHPHELNVNKVNAQQARRILDRIVGYHLSPLLWKKVAKGLSAGRVQSVALRLLVERERQIRDFTPEEYWEIEVDLKRRQPEFELFRAALVKCEGEKISISDVDRSEAIVHELRQQQFRVKGINAKEKSRHPSAPFITSTLQQDAFNKLRFTASKTMLIAQQLYEGIELGQEGPSGLITYMRTDSVQLAKPAIAQIRKFIQERYGAAYLPEKPNHYKSKRSAQEAHEAIRPTDISRLPESVDKFLTKDQSALYELIWKRTVASQMTSARYLNRSAEIVAGRYLLTANGSTLVFDGFLSVLLAEERGPEKNVPELIAGEPLDAMEFFPTQHFTRPPPRYSEASLVKALEEEGIGRPSTYAPIIQTLAERNYIRREKGYLWCAELGMNVCDILISYFPRVMDVHFTAAMEGQLDQVEDGTQDWVAVLREFFVPFKEKLDYAQQNLQKQVVESGQLCEKCGRPMLIKWSSRGKFLGCAGFPECRNARPITTGVKCPEPSCDGELVARRSKRGLTFYGCTRYPECRYVSRQLTDKGDSDGDSTADGATEQPRVGS